MDYPTAYEERLCGYRFAERAQFPRKNSRDEDLYHPSLVIGSIAGLCERNRLLISIHASGPAVAIASLHLSVNDCGS
jgi:hypothetical protein